MSSGKFDTTYYYVYIGFWFPNWIATSRLLLEILIFVAMFRNYVSFTLVHCKVSDQRIVFPPKTPLAPESHFKSRR